MDECSAIMEEHKEVNRDALNNLQLDVQGNVAHHVPTAFLARVMFLDSCISTRLFHLTGK